MKDFALIGAAGFIAPKHLKAIKDTGNRLVAAVDKFDSVGILDRYFPSASFFTEFERFDRHIEKLSRNGKRVDYLSVCSPNYLHDAHIRFGLRYGSTVICEKPLVLNPWNVEALNRIQQETGNAVYTILQLRFHPDVIAFKEKIKNADPDKIFDIDLTYIAPRGNWYHASWKGDIQKSGGIATNIGIHFFDMLLWIFGGVKENTVHVHEPECAAGFLQLERARVRWYLSIDEAMLPENIKQKGQRSYRAIQLDDDAIEFSQDVPDLHTKNYEAILDGKGFTPDEVMASIELVHRIRTEKPVGLKGDYHPFCNPSARSHPFEIKQAGK